VLVGGEAIAIPKLNSDAVLSAEIQAHGAMKRPEFTILENKVLLLRVLTSAHL
jgi:hypothetical protein